MGASRERGRDDITAEGRSPRSDSRRRGGRDRSRHGSDDGGDVHSKRVREDSNARSQRDNPRDEPHRSRNDDPEDSPTRKRKEDTGDDGDRKSRERSRRRSPIRRDRRPRDRRKRWSRSPSEKQKKPFKFDSPPKELAAQLDGSGTSLLGLPQTVVSSSSTIKEAFNATLAAERQKIARELYIGQIPPGISAAHLIDVLNDSLMNMGANAMPGRPIVHGWLGGDGLFAFVEFRTAEEASIALERLNGHQLKSYGVSIKVGRPKGYMGPAPEDSVNAYTAGGNTASSSSSAIPGGISAAEVASDTSRLCLIGFPLKASEHSIKRALRSAAKGEIRHLEILKHTWNDEQIVLAVFECVNIEDEHRLKKKGEVEIQGVKARIINPKDAIVKGYMNFDGDIMKKGMGLEVVPSRVLVMTNFAGSVEELLDDINYSDLMDDIKVECKSITGGADVRSIIIPRPETNTTIPTVNDVNTPNGDAHHHDSATMEDSHQTTVQGNTSTAAVPAVDMQVPGLGCCFIEFRSVEEAGQVKRILDGRIFGGHEVFVTYFSETRFQRGDFANPMPNTDEPEVGLKDIGENAPLLDDGMDTDEDDNMVDATNIDDYDDGEQDMRIHNRDDVKARKRSKQPSPSLAAEDLEIID
ncbi:conserved hypothetical protein [Perkinsus marinus ATCC 50983]|uniref:RRM domain-containing protein n=1 Tax=Perkinsus marinus (strain ATCC 50983 / TXsc) TaxID=423536 RepID=C5LR66_PERM5|nr:conserved hypothetical protein [Perkinsus marinus ATCC 50983]EER00951.1 conserved hypothetical protein [Perkinsus marinus ATCC 50983]|eukprot:XP_002768233.1 conserved hypothetical protein [Perkinsus marinus ATCC 50983]